MTFKPRTDTKDTLELLTPALEENGTMYGRTAKEL